MSTPPLEGAIVFTDLVGFTEYTATRGDDNALAVLGAQERIVNDALPAGGRVVKELGDGLLLFLPDSPVAVAACLAILDGFERAAASDEMPLWVRVGLHWGRPSRRRDDLVGHDVNVAARIVDVAAPGELLCSGSMLDASPSTDDAIDFVELGPVMMKGIPDPIDLYRVERVEPRATGRRGGPERDMTAADPGYWPSRWPAEDGGPRRTQRPRVGPGLGIRPGERLETTSREVAAATMVVLRDPGQAYLLRHTGGDDAISWVEQIDPETLEVVTRSPDLPGGPTWPGGLAAHANGSLYVAFGNHVHRLGADAVPIAARRLPRRRPYNSFVVLPDGHLATKDFGGTRPGGSGPSPEPTELLVLEPDRLEIVARLTLPERSIARLSADGDDIYVVGDTTLFRVRWDGHRAELDAGFQPRYRTIDGQTYGWDAVIDAGAAWFLDNGAGSERYAGTFRGQGISEAPLHLVRVDLTTGSVELIEICGRPNGIIANPPLVDPARGIAVGYDSGNGVLAAFSLTAGGALEPRWTRAQDHASHMVQFADTGEIVTADYDRDRGADQVVILDIETGEEIARADTGSPVQSVVFPCPGFDRDLYLCSFTTLTRVRVAG